STKLLKRYNGILNSWELIEDQKAIDAYTAASTAQDTADAKRRVFVSQPIPPYDIGDLWTDGDTGDLKKCKTAKSSGSYSADDWELATSYNADIAEINNSVSTLETNVNNISSDGFITLPEAESLRISLRDVNKESLDIITIATKLGVTTELTNYQTALTNLQTELNSWITAPDGTYAGTYPITVTSTNRNNIRTKFETVQDKKSILINAMGEVRNSNVAGWGIESGGAITISNLATTVDAIATIVSFDEETHILTVDSTTGFPDSGSFYYAYDTGAIFEGTTTIKVIDSKTYTSKDATHFYGVENSLSEADLANFIVQKVYTHPTAKVDINISSSVAVTKYQTRLNPIKTDWLNYDITIGDKDYDGWVFGYIYIDTSGDLNIVQAGTSGGGRVYPPDPPDGCIRVGYLIFGNGNEDPSGSLTSDRQFDSNGIPIYKVIIKQDFRYRDDKLIQYNSTDIGANITTYDSTIVTATVSARSYYTTYIPLGISKRQCDVSITSNTSITAADTLRQGAKFTVGRKPAGGSSAGIKLVSGVYVDASGYATHVDQKRHSTNPAYGDYIVPPTALNVYHTTIYDMDLIPYPTDLTQICLKIVFYNYYSSSETVNLRITWQAT
ncbi:MAG: hypothetical protein ACOX6N_05455, partial [Patescibacteria group bacterium]